MTAPAIGDTIPELVVQIGREDLIRYAGAADDYVRQHWDHPFMVDNGFPDVAVHGWLTFAHMCRAVTESFASERWAIERYTVRYLRPTFPGKLTCGGRISAADASGVEVELWGIDEAGEKTTSGMVHLAPTRLS